MRFQSYFNTAIRIIQLYDGAVPLQHFLKQYFALHKKHGSKDRKYITHLCYNFYRSGKSFKDISTEEQLKIALFLCNDNAGEWGFLYDNDWLDNWSNVLNERIAFIQKKYDSFSLDAIFPFANELSEGIDKTAFLQSFFIQPDVFIRTRQGHYADVINKLQEHNIPFNVVEENCISFSPSININSIIKIDEEAVIQDYSSQHIKEFLDPIKNQQSEIYNPQSVWDCCAGSGGKSILAYDVLAKIDLTVSDVRPSIIQNLKERFEKAGIKNYKRFIADITGSKFQMTNSKLQIPNHGFDLIICDVPCTGSGTWSRTPEQLYFFQPEKINAYALLQKKIISNTISLLKNNGYLIYITCSVFKKENEMVSNFIKEELHLELIKSDLLRGYHKKADTMFAALFRKIQ
jgi:16S rRNA (cytosine967-C5)-methyltransferase